jgi:hypothetical protein
MIENMLIAGSIISFIALFSVVVYFRIKVLKAYGILIRNRVQFDIQHIFNKKKLETEILPKYPEQKKEIMAFVTGIRLSITMVSVLMFIITFCGATLMFFR